MPDKQYSVDGTLYQIPEAEAKSFLKDFPKAQEVNVFIAGKDTLGIPINEVDSFLKDVPNAKPFGKEEPIGEAPMPDLSYIKEASGVLQPEGEEIPSPQDVYKVTATDQGSGKGKESELANVVGDVLGAPAQAFHGGLKEGTEKIIEGSKEVGSPMPVENLLGGLHLVEGFAKGAFGAMNFLPPVAAFSAGIVGAEKAVETMPQYIQDPFNAADLIQPKQALNALLAPVTTFLESAAPESLKNEMVRSGASIADMALPIVVGVLGAKGKGKLVEDITAGKEVKGKDISEAQEVISSAKPEDFQEAARKVVVDNLPPEISQLKDAEIKLSQSRNKLSSVLGEQAAAELIDPKLQEATAKVNQQATNLEVKANLDAAAEAVKDDPIASEIIAEKQKLAQQEIDKLKPQEDAIQKPIAESLLPREQEKVGERGGEREGVGSSIEGEKVTQEGKEVNPFEKSTQLFYDISDAAGATKKRKLAKERQTFLDENPSVKHIDDNWKEISRQLEENKLIEKKGNCP